MCFAHLEASLELILSSFMRNECDLFELNSDEVMCFSLVSFVSGLVVASCESVCGRVL